MNYDVIKCSHTRMVEGHPVTYMKTFSKDPFSIYDTLISRYPEDIQKKVFQWIKENIFPRKTPLDYPDSYGLKHILERATGIYLNDNTFKDAMLQCGFEPIEYLEASWRFRISKRSPAFIEDRKFFK